jgi:hypothetical protein
MAESRKMSQRAHSLFGASAAAPSVRHNQCVRIPGGGLMASGYLTFPRTALAYVVVPFWLSLSRLGKIRLRVVVHLGVSIPAKSLTWCR